MKVNPFREIVPPKMQRWVCNVCGFVVSATRDDHISKACVEHTNWKHGDVEIDVEYLRF